MPSLVLGMSVSKVLLTHKFIFKRVEFIEANAAALPTSAGQTSATLQAVQVEDFTAHYCGKLLHSWVLVVEVQYYITVAPKHIF